MTRDDALIERIAEAIHAATRTTPTGIGLPAFYSPTEAMPAARAALAVARPGWRAAIQAAAEMVADEYGLNLDDYPTLRRQP